MTREKDFAPDGAGTRSRKIAPLDPLGLELDRTTLIEASAGTGKTYTITTLFARLVARGYPVESILVVTFTEAAAAELKLRIRKRISACVSAGFPSGKACGHEPHADELVAFFRGRPDADLIFRRLRLALACFDQAAVMTIHSFCFSVLKDNAFESNAYFDMELLPDSSGFFRQAAMDYFYARINDQDPLFLKFLAKQGVTPERLGEELCRALARPGIRIIPETAEFKEIWDDYRDIVKQLSEVLGRERDTVLDLIQTHKGVDKRSYSKKNLPKWLDHSLDLLTGQGDAPVFEMTEKGDPLYKFTRTRLAQKTKSGHAPPDHPFFDLCEALLVLHQAMAGNLIAVKLEFLAYLRGRLKEMKSMQGACFFDDLINDLDAALAAGDGHRLKRAVLDRYRACLIDEFQDTDPGQYAIFSRLFGTSPAEEPQRPFLMIGDPKQAIYAFRGGDIFAYLSASKASDQAFTLPVNYRSAPRLVRGVNHLFSRIPDPFGFREIPFIPVSTPDAATDRLSDGTGFVPPLNMVFISREGMGKDRSGLVKKAAALASVPDILAADILDILNRGGSAKDNSAPAEHTGSAMGFAGTDGSPDIAEALSPGDMAVLVRTNSQAEAVQQALSRANIPSFVSKTGSVFDSPEAVALFDLLSAVDNTGHTGLLKAALASPVYGWDAVKIRGLDNDERLMWQWQDRFRTYHDLWEEKGFVAMISRLFHDDAVSPAPCSLVSERSLTNFYHLIELVSRAALHQHLSRPYLVKWYERQLTPETREDAADELRLESDARAVAIVTIHKSKGLEYPMVFLPYLWAGSTGSVSKGPALYHAPDDGHRLCLDLGSPDIDAARTQMAEEERAEEMRLLYVALTRASAMCRIYWGGFAGAEASALGRLLHPDGCGDDDAMIRDLEQCAAGGEDCIESLSYDAPPDTGPYASGAAPRKNLAPEAMNRQVEINWRISSYSALISGRSPDTPVVMEDTPAPQAEQTEPIPLDAFPRGAGAGDFFHAVFESLDFTDPATIPPGVDINLDRYGFDGMGLTKTAVRAVTDILATPLSTPGKGRAFALEEISGGQRFTELEFCFDVSGFDAPGLARLFGTRPETAAYADRLAGMDILPFKGFIKGFIDLVVRHDGKWYILDYKSNHLGPVFGDYSARALDHAMAEHDYILQYHLYLVALDRYLALRLKDYDYDAHFGGIFYLFIRGMAPDRDTGVFFDCPPKDFMKGFQALI